ncbi:MAG: hypothetical protein NC489_08590 [Ruminococcus flavefaciens]|nr:hypothetical protein [Ruminococcus flavefaciens]
MVTPFKFEKEKVVVDCFAVELYLPAEYADSAYRGTPYYSVLGTKIKFLGIGNFRFFNSEKEMEHPENYPCYPFGIPMLITTEPMEIDVRNVKFSKDGPERNCLVLTYLKGDPFIVNKEVIKNSDPLMMYLSRLEQGKLDHIPPEVAVQILQDCESMNGLSLRIPSEEEEIFIAERYRDPDHPERAYRYHTGNLDPDRIVSRNMRTDAHQATTFQAVMHEDISTGLITSTNRHRRGETDQIGLFEALIRGKDMSQFAEQDKEGDNNDAGKSSTG